VWELIGFRVLCLGLIEVLRIFRFQAPLERSGVARRRFSLIGSKAKPWGSDAIYPSSSLSRTIGAEAEHVFGSVAKETRHGS
jgi:hypothetical protein